MPTREICCRELVDLAQTPQHREQRPRAGIAECHLGKSPASPGLGHQHRETEVEKTCFIMGICSQMGMCCSLPKHPHTMAEGEPDRNSTVSLSQRVSSPKGWPTRAVR